MLVGSVKYGPVIKGVFVLGMGLHLFGSGSGDICLISYVTIFGVLVWPGYFLICLLILSNLLHVFGNLLHW